MSLSPAALKILLLVIYSIISVSALILIKLGGAHRPWLPPIDWSRIAQLVAGCTLYVCSFAIWIFVLSIMELTAAYPIAIALTLKNGDYLLAFTGNKLATWFHRGVTPYFSKDSLLKTQNAYDMQLVAKDEIKSPALYINTWNYRPEIRQTSLGYKLYRVLEDEPKFLWSGRYPDGWMGTTASLLVNENFKGPVAIRISAPYFAMPNKMVLFAHDVAASYISPGLSGEGRHEGRGIPDACWSDGCAI